MIYMCDDTEIANMIHNSQNLVRKYTKTERALQLNRCAGLYFEYFME